MDDFAYDDEQDDQDQRPCRLTEVRWPPLEIPTRLISVVICRDPM